MTTDLVLVRLDAARLALSEAKTIQDTKKILDIAIAVEVFAKRQKLGGEIELQAVSFKAEALRQLGNMLKETDRNEGGRPQKTSAKKEPVYPTLSEIGLDKKTSKLAQDIASLPESEFDKVKQGVITIAKAQENIKGDKRRGDRLDKISTMAQPKELGGIGKFSLIYADPAWEYEFSESDNRDLSNQYPTMTLDSIRAMPVQDISTDDCILFIWATSPKLEEALSVIASWGFTYKTNMVWVKDKIGMGYYARQRHESLLIATKGSIPVPLPKDRPDSVIESPRGKHSAKPEIVYTLIESMYPTLAKVELFARSKRDGWLAWGNQP